MQFSESPIEDDPSNSCKCEGNILVAGLEQRLSYNEIACNLEMLLGGPPGFSVVSETALRLVGDRSWDIRCWPPAHRSGCSDEVP